MSQLVIKPGVATPFGAAAQHVQQRGHEVAAAWIAAVGGITTRLLEPGDLYPRPEPAYLERSRMSREMYRL
jgi:hypothetical protein